MPKTIFIAGASVRCAVDSAVQSGYTPLAADLFADYDLRQHCQAYRIETYPTQLLDISRDLPGVPWMYTGGLENHPSLVDQISRKHLLMGNPGNVLRQAYNPFLIRDILADENLPFPEISRIPPATITEKWLRKPFRSTGGHGIAALSPQDASTASEPDRSNKDIYFQRFLDGPCYSATFLASDHTCDLLGVTRQLVGKQFTNGPSFGYCGSIGPIRLTRAQKSTLNCIGQALIATIPLRGLFGIDFAWHAEQAWTLEINPRFPASVEILEIAFGLSATGLHCQACLNPDEVSIRPTATNLQYGKAIIYAREPCTITTENYQYWITRTGSQRITNGDPCSWFADIPIPDTRISVGHPILTVLAQDNNSHQVLRQLIRTGRQVQQDCHTASPQEPIEATKQTETL
jgi:predicted ATP-grasp superfamily ATP-dependent carboligase